MLALGTHELGLRARVESSLNALLLLGKVNNIHAPANFNHSATTCNC
jgi:hypothetical protein